MKPLHIPTLADHEVLESPAEVMRRLRRESLEHLAMVVMERSGVPSWKRELRFHGTRMWRFDFAWPDCKVALEVDGGTHSGGRHTRPGGFRGDCAKLNEAAIAGWTVIRCTKEHIKSGEIVDWVMRALGLPVPEKSAVLFGRAGRRRKGRAKRA